MASPHLMMLVEEWKTSGPVGTVIELRGTDFTGFEGDIDVIVKNAAGEHGLVVQNFGSPTGKPYTFRFTLPEKLCTSDTSYSGLDCPSYMAITPGAYTIYVQSWAKPSNTVQFTVTAP